MQKVKTKDAIPKDAFFPSKLLSVDHGDTDLSASC